MPLSLPELEAKVLELESKVQALEARHQRCLPAHGVLATLVNPARTETDAAMNVAVKNVLDDLAQAP